MVFIFIGTTLFGHFHKAGITLKCLILERKLELWVLGKDLRFPQRDHKIDRTAHSIPCSAWGQKSFLLQHQTESLHPSYGNMSSSNAQTNPSFPMVKELMGAPWRNKLCPNDPDTPTQLHEIGYRSTELLLQIPERSS